MSEISANFKWVSIKCKYCGELCKLRDRKDEIGEYQIAFCSGCGGAVIVDDGEIYWYTAEQVSTAVRMFHGID